MAFGRAFRAPLVGLDLGSSTARAVALRRTRSGWSLVAAGEAALPAGSIDEGAAEQPTAVADTIRDLLATLGLRRARIAAALAGHAVIVKRLTLPAMSRAELDEAIPWEAEQYIPFDLADVQIDYQVLDSDNDSSVDVLLVAAKRDRIDDRAGVIALAGPQPVVLDVEAFALANAYQVNYPERHDPLTVLVHLGRSSMIVCLLERGRPAFTRDIAAGSRVHVQALERELGLEEADAERTLRGHPPSGVDRAEVSRLLREASGQLALEIRKTIDFYRATAPVERLDRIVLSGGACGVQGLDEQLAAEFQAEVELCDPFRRIARPARGAAADVSGPAYAVAVGLALRKEGDR